MGRIDKPSNDPHEAYTKNHAGRGRPHSLKCRRRTEMSLPLSPRVETTAEGNTRASVREKYGEDIAAMAGNQPERRKQTQAQVFTHGEDVKDRRSSQAVACMKRCTQEPGSPIRLLDVDKANENVDQGGAASSEEAVLRYVEAETGRSSNACWNILECRNPKLPKEGGCIRVALRCAGAETGTTGEPDAGKPHVRTVLGCRVTGIPTITVFWRR